MRPLFCLAVLAAACTSSSAPPPRAEPPRSPAELVGRHVAAGRADEGLHPGLVAPVTTALSPADLEGRHVDGPPPVALHAGLVPREPQADLAPGERDRAGRPVEAPVHAGLVAPPMVEGAALDAAALAR